MTYTIYRLENKIGCTNDIVTRAYNYHLSTEALQVLEVHDDIELASKREIELQLEYFGKRDSGLSYFDSVNSMTVEQRKQAGSKGGKIGGKIAGKLAKESGQLSSRGKLGGAIGGKIQGKANVESGHCRNNVILANNKVRTCPYCGKQGKSATFYRHRKACKLKHAI